MEIAVLNTPSTRFDEKALRADIVKQWGEFGAHVEVFDELLAEIQAARQQASSIPEIVIKAIGILNVEIVEKMVRLGSTLADKEEKKALSKEIQRKSAAIGVLAKIRGEVVCINRQWRIPSERGDRFYTSLWDAQSDLGACNCQAGANGHECKHVESARALILASEVQ